MNAQPTTTPATPAPTATGQGPDRDLAYQPVVKWAWLAGLLTLWAATQLLSYFLVGHAYDWVNGDVNYYHWALTNEGLQSLPEYPRPIVWLFGLLSILPGAQAAGAYLAYFVALILGGGLIVLIYLWAKGYHEAAVWWILALACLGPIGLFRYDLIPAYIIVAACLALRHHPAVAGALIAVGASLKLWPALLISTLIGRDRARLKGVIAFTCTGLSLALAALVVHGLEKNLAPLSYQSQRGIEIESLMATPLMVARAFNPGAYQVFLSDFKAFEIIGPGAVMMQQVGSLLAVAPLVYAIYIGYRSWRGPALTWEQSMWAIVSMIGVLICTNKVFSPQYLAWWIAPAVLLTIAVSIGVGRFEAGSGPINPGTARRVPAGLTLARINLVMLCAIAVLTQIIFPVLWADMIGDDRPLTFLYIVIARNLAVLVVTVLQVAITLRLCARPAVVQAGAASVQAGAASGEDSTASVQADTASVRASAEPNQAP